MSKTTTTPLPLPPILSHQLSSPSLPCLCSHLPSSTDWAHYTCLHHSYCLRYRTVNFHHSVHSLNIALYTASTLHYTQPQHCTIHSLNIAVYTASTLHYTQPQHCSVHSLNITLYTASTLHYTQPQHYTIHSLNITLYKTKPQHCNVHSFNITV